MARAGNTPNAERWISRGEMRRGSVRRCGSESWRNTIDLAFVLVLPASPLEPATEHSPVFVRSGFRRWRRETDPAVRRFIESRILNDAGVLGHYVTDGSNPHHTTKHHDRWVGDNPRAFTAEPGFHNRLEAQFVSANVTLADLLGAVTEAPVVHASLRDATLEHIRAAHARLIRLYELDQQLPFGRTNASAEHKAFAVERLAAGARMLRDIWWTAWTRSGPQER